MVTSLGTTDVEIITTVDDRWVTVRLHQTSVTDLPLVGPFLPDVDLDEEVTMLREPPLG